MSAGLADTFCRLRTLLDAGGVRHAFIGARTATVLGAPVRLAAPEASIVYKLLASRRKGLDDVESVFAARAAAGEALDRALLDRWCRDWEIEDRLQPFRERFGG